MNMLNKFIGKPFLFTVPKSLTYSNKLYLHISDKHIGDAHHHPGVTVKRIIKCIGERLRKVDPQRWETVPITFQTHFRDENGYADVTTSIHIHDALEREFGFDVKDRQVLITDIETAFYIVMQSHDAN